MISWPRPISYLIIKKIKQNLTYMFMLRMEFIHNLNIHMKFSVVRMQAATAATILFLLLFPIFYRLFLFSLFFQCC